MLAQQTVRSGLCENNLRADPVAIIVIITSLYSQLLSLESNTSMRLQVRLWGLACGDTSQSDSQWGLTFPFLSMQSASWGKDVLFIMRAVSCEVWGDWPGENCSQHQRLVLSRRSYQGNRLRIPEILHYYPESDTLRQLPSRNPHHSTHHRAGDAAGKKKHPDYCQAEAKLGSLFPNIRVRSGLGWVLGGAFMLPGGSELRAHIYN